MVDEYDEAVRLFYEAHENYRRQEFDKAIKSGEQAIALYPEFAPVYNVVGNAYYAKKNYKKSIEMNKLAVELTDKKEKDVKNDKSLSADPKTKEMLNGLKEAKAAYYFNLGNAYDDSGDLNNALDCFTKAIELNPDFPNPYNSRGLVYEKLSNYSDAINDFTKAIEKNYHHLHYAYNNRANAYEKLGKYDDAIADCREAVRIDPAYANAYNTCGISYELKGDLENARVCFEKAIAIDPNHSNAKHNLKNIGKPHLTSEQTITVTLKKDDD